MSKAAVAALGLVLLTGCSGLGGSAAATSPSSSTTASPPAHGRLDPAAPTPPGFPADVPTYPGARLTAGANFTSSGQNTFGMEWETLDGLDKVHTFYAAKLNQGDWIISFTGATATNFTAVFSRKSNSKETGIVGADSVSGVTRISLSLVLPG